MRMLKYLATIVCASAFAFALVGCSGGSVAATVNGENIYESDVTSTIELMRSTYGLEDDAQWSQYLQDSSLTPSQIREDVINSMAQEMLVKQIASENGITVEDSEVDAYVDQIKKQYGDDGFKQALKEYGFTEESFRESYKTSRIEEQVKQQLIDFDRPSDDEVAKQLSSNPDSYKGKRSSHILFDLNDKATAEEVLKQLKNGANFSDMAKKYSKDPGSGANGGDVGWDCLTTFVEPYQAALDKLGKGQMTQQLVESEFGYHIILCTDVFDVKKGSKVKASDVPEEIYQDVYESMLTERANESYAKWLEEILAKADVVINDMPSGLSYDIANAAGSSNASE